MIAAFKVLLPFRIHIPLNVQLDTLFARFGDLEIEIPPPYQCSVDDADLDISSQTTLLEILGKMGQKEIPAIDPCLQIEGNQSLAGNALAIMFKKESFDRSVSSGHPYEIDPPLASIFFILNKVITQLRATTKAPFIRAISSNSIWRLDYLNDDGSQLPKEEGKVRAHLASGFKWKYCGLNNKVWTSLINIPFEKEMAVWEDMYLDAINILPNCGSAIVLAFSAIEILVSQVLERKAKKTMQPYGIWEWLNDRSQYWHEPSVTDRINRLLKEFTGHSIKDEPTLWTPFKRLKSARDTFVHTGSLAIDNKLIDEIESVKLLNQAKLITEWLVGFLPQEERPLTAPTEPKIEILKRLA